MSSSRRHASPAQTPVGWLGKDAQGARVLGTAQLLLSVQEAVRATLPPAMAGFCHVARIEGQQITLAVPGAVHASRLRQVAPRVLERLTQAGWNLTEIRIRVQAGLYQQRDKTAPVRQVAPLDAGGLTAFESLRSALPDGPLAQAIEALLRRHHYRD